MAARRRFSRVRGAVSRASSRIATVARRATRRPRAVVARVVAASAPVRRAVARPISYLRTKRAASRSSGVDLKAIAVQTLMNSLGGVSSAIGSAIPKLTKTTADDDPVLIAAVKGGIGVGVRWLFGGSSNAREFVGGWNGHTAGSAFETFVVNKLKSA